MTQSSTSGRAQVRLSVPEIERLLQIPEGTHITRMQVDFDPQGVRLLIEGPGLPVVPVDAEAPFLIPHAERVEVPVVVSERVRWS